MNNLEDIFSYLKYSNERAIFVTNYSNSIETFIEKYKKSISSSTLKIGYFSTENKFKNSLSIEYYDYKNPENVLGKTHDIVIFDKCEKMNPNSIGCGVGTVRGGGIILFCFDDHNFKFNFEKDKEDLISVDKKLQIDNNSQKLNYSADTDNKSNDKKYFMVENMNENNYLKRMLVLLDNFENAFFFDSNFNFDPISIEKAKNLAIKNVKKVTSSDMKVSKETSKLYSPKELYIQDTINETDANTNLNFLSKNKLNYNISVDILNNLCATSDQRSGLALINESILSNEKEIFLAISQRGRGKSTMLGLSLILALKNKVENICITSESIENIDIILKSFISALKKFGLTEGDDFYVNYINMKSKTVIEKKNLFINNKKKNFYKNSPHENDKEDMGIENKIKERFLGVDLSDSAFISTKKSPQENFNKNNIKEITVKIDNSHKCVIRYEKFKDVKFSKPDILIIDEAASIPITELKKLFVADKILIASTVDGYEGTGRAFVHKFLSQLADSDSTFLNNYTIKDFILTEPIRYNENDKVEKWITNFLILGSNICIDRNDNKLEEIELKKKIEKVLHDEIKKEPLDFDISKLEAYVVNRDLLFSGDGVSEKILGNMIHIFTDSHYKNSTNDLMKMANTKNHELIVILNKNNVNLNNYENIYSTLWLVYEKIDDGYEKKALGEDIISTLDDKKTENKSKTNNFEKNKSHLKLSKDGNLIPWVLYENYAQDEILKITGYRIIRVAVNKKYERMGIGSYTIDILSKLAFGSKISFNKKYNEDKLLCKIEESDIFDRKIDYLGVSFGATNKLINFWKKNCFKPIYIKQTKNKHTGEYSAIFIKKPETYLNTTVSDLDLEYISTNKISSEDFATEPGSLSVNHDLSIKNKRYSKNLQTESYEIKGKNTIFLTLFVDYRLRLIRLLSNSFKDMLPSTFLSLFYYKDFKTNRLKNTNIKFSENELKRIEIFIKRKGSLPTVRDLIYDIAFSYFAGVIKDECYFVPDNGLSPLLSVLQQSVLMIIGLQGKDFEDAESILGVKPYMTHEILRKAVENIYPFLL